MTTLQNFSYNSNYYSNNIKPKIKKFNEDKAVSICTWVRGSKASSLLIPEPTESTFLVYIIKNAKKLNLTTKELSYLLNNAFNTSQYNTVGMVSLYFKTPLMTAIDYTLNHKLVLSKNDWDNLIKKSDLNISNNKGETALSEIISSVFYLKADIKKIPQKILKYIIYNTDYKKKNEQGLDYLMYLFRSAKLGMEHDINIGLPKKYLNHIIDNSDLKNKVDMTAKHSFYNVKETQTALMMALMAKITLNEECYLKLYEKSDIELISHSKSFRNNYPIEYARFCKLQIVTEKIYLSGAISNTTNATKNRIKI